MSQKSTYPLRLPSWVKAEAEKVAEREGTSLNHLVALALTEKIATLNTEDYFAKRRGKTDWDAFGRIMARPQVGPVATGDELPEGYARPTVSRPMGAGNENQ